MGGRSWSFSRWRHARPFWGALFITLAGAEILITVKAPLPVVVHVGMQGLAGMLVPLLLLLCGILLFVNPDQRLFYSLVSTVLTLASWVTSNLGGFFIGLLLGLIGSSLAFAWSPTKARRKAHRKARIEAQRNSPDSAGGRQAEAEQAERGQAGASPHTVQPDDGLLDGRGGRHELR